jgi:hypothetical protein
MVEVAGEPGGVHRRLEHGGRAVRQDRGDVAGALELLQGVDRIRIGVEAQIEVHEFVPEPVSSTPWAARA